MTTSINKKIYNLYVKTIKSFSIFLEGFTVTDSWTLLITQYNSLVSSLSEQANLTLDMITNGTLFSISIMKLREMISLTLVGAISLVLTISETLKLQTIMTNDLLLSLTMRLQSTLSVTMDEMALDIVFTPILAQFYLLSDWDSDTLATMDVETLQDLDYTTA